MLTQYRTSDGTATGVTVPDNMAQFVKATTGFDWTNVDYPSDGNYHFDSATQKWLVIQNQPVQPQPSAEQLMVMGLTQQVAMLNNEISEMKAASSEETAQSQAASAPSSNASQSQAASASTSQASSASEGSAN